MTSLTTPRTIGRPPTAWESSARFVDGGFLRRRAARKLVRTLRGPVVDTALRLLPGYVDSDAARWLGATSLIYAQPQAIVDDLDPSLEQVPTLRWTGLLMHEVAAAVIHRRDLGSQHPRFQLQPDPAPELVMARRETVSWAQRTLSMVMPATRADQVGAAIATQLRQICTDGTDQAWGGWGMMATLVALHRHHHEIPLPGIRSRRWSRGMSVEAMRVITGYTIGSASVVAAAGTLIRQIESSSTGHTDPWTPPGGWRRPQPA